MSKIVPKTNVNQKDKYLVYRDKNSAFLKIMQNQSKEEDDTNLNQHVKKVMKKIQDLQLSERRQWSLFISKKCEQLLGKGKLRQLKFMLKVLITICSKYKIQYDENKIEELVKHVYLQKYGNQVINYFQKAGYSTQQYQILQYQDPWYVKAYKYVSNFF